MPTSSGSRSIVTLMLCGLSLLGAFLLFQVQPVMSKFILPWFGGSPGVWTTCMLFFQVVLFLGYAYAHAVTLLPRKWQGVVHGVLVLGALACLPVSPSDAWKPLGGEEPTGRILLLLAATVGLPYFVLSSTSPLVQVWFTRAVPGGRPWRLYALSNIGSLAALLSYPFFFEPRWDVAGQVGMWSVAFGAFALLSVYGVWQDRRAGALADKSGNPEPPVAEAAPLWWHRVLWVALPALASIMLLATTNHVCQDVAVVPFMWVAPLSLYLITFIICFEHERWYVPALWAAAAMLLLFLALGWRDLSSHWNRNFVQEAAAYFAAMFAACMVCHGELTRLKPSHGRLTEFYLMMSAGGALGGLTVSLIAPRVFNTYLEWPLGLIVCFLMAGVVVAREVGRGGRRWVQVTVAAILLLVVALIVTGFFKLASEVDEEGVVGAGARMDYLVKAWAASVKEIHASFSRWQLGFEIGLLIAGSAAVIVTWMRRKSVLQAIVTSSLVVATWITLFFMQDWGFTLEPRIERLRNFYGVISVSEDYDTGLEVDYRTLSHGRITHGIQNMGAYREIPITYYGKDTGIGIALKTLKHKPDARVGVVGMGTGTVACYGMPGHVFRFYDINPDIVRLAKKHFTYLADMEKRGAKLEVVIADARLALEREESQHFDVILLDAFSGDSVPVHLLTKEAFTIYKRHLKPDGIIAVHVTNAYLLLAPVIDRVAASLDLKTTRVETDSDGDDYSTDYVLVTNNAKFLAANPRDPDDEVILEGPVWTDKNHNLFEILDRD